MAKGQILVMVIKFYPEDNQQKGNRIRPPFLNTVFNNHHYGISLHPGEFFQINNILIPVLVLTYLIIINNFLPFVSFWGLRNLSISAKKVFKQNACFMTKKCMLCLKTCHSLVPYFLVSSMDLVEIQWRGIVYCLGHR